MKKMVLVFVAVLAVQAPARAEWVDLSKGLSEPGIEALAVSKESGTLYAVSIRRVYRYDGEEKGWKQVLSLRGQTARVHRVVSGSRDTVYAATDKGVQKSENAGKSWKRFYRGIGEKAKAVYDLIEKDGRLLLATEAGLAYVEENGTARRVGGFPETAVYALFDGKGFYLAASDSGLFQSTDGGENWKKVSFEAKEEQQEDRSLSQFRIEELRTAGPQSAIIHVPGQDRYLAASVSGLLESADAQQWKRSALTPSPEVRHLSASSDTFYAATGRGVYQWEPARGLFKDLSDGLPSRDVRQVLYDPGSGDLFAASEGGVHRYPKPEFRPVVPAETLVQKPQEFLKLFGHEPDVRAIQQAAIHYAEVSPEKIEAWRRAASKRALLPTFSVGTDMGQDQNIDLDRGGTNDPDRFIIGPEEKTLDWHVDVSWDLADLVWNGDQTSIDTRSKLMVELRDDILNEVTHLYFERRRLQAELAMAPPASLALQVEKELKLQELTADVDALTGGFLSRSLSEALDVRRG